MTKHGAQHEAMVVQAEAAMSVSALSAFRAVPDPEKQTLRDARGNTRSCFFAQLRFLSQRALRVSLRANAGRSILA